MENIIIKNEFLTAEISPKGAEIQSVKTPCGTEFIWNGNPDIWAKRTPVLFPICGRLKGGKYLYNGKEYEMTGHGFALRKEFDVKSVCENSAVFSLKADEETKECYPFDFEFEVCFTLNENSLKVDYKTTNLSKSEPMYFSCGSHEGFACPEGIEEYSIVFDKEVDLNPHPTCGEIIEAYTVELAKNVKELKLKDEFFKIDALVFEHLGINKLSLVHNNSSRKVTVEFPNHDYLLFWTKYKAPYLCIEPWAGFPDTPESDGIFENKKGINRLEADETKIFSHILTFEK